MNRKSIVSINGVHVLCESNQDAATMISLIKCTVSDNGGYGKDQKWKEERACELGITSVPEANVSLIDDAEGGRDLIKKLEDDLSKQRSEASELESNLKREKKFWEVRNKAHALGYTDEELRKKLSSWFTYSEFKIEKKECL